jgi:type I restriction enzyme S subunit
MLDMEAIKDFSIDKSDWKKVKFGDVVFEPKESVKDPITEGIEHVVGLDHISSDDIHLRRSASIEESTTFTKKFSIGDVLFGRRRAYLKKAAKAEFEGVCSGDITVMRAKKGVLIPDLLPFIVNNDKFFDHAITHSAGGLSPRVKFKDLASYEFFLPEEKIDQLKLFELLNAATELKLKYEQQLYNLNMYYETAVNSFFTEVHDGWNYVPLKSISSINHKTLTSKTKDSYKFKYLDLSSIEGPKKVGAMSSLTYGEAPSRARRIVSDNSSVIALVRPYQRAFVFIKDAKDIISSTGTAVVCVKTKLDERFLFHQFFSSKFLRFCERMMTGSTYPAITPDDLGLYKIGLPYSKKEQISIAMKLDEIEKNQAKAETLLNDHFVMYRNLINKVF